MDRRPSRTSLLLLATTLLVGTLASPGPAATAASGNASGPAAAGVSSPTVSGPIPATAAPIPLSAMK